MNRRGCLIALAALFLSGCEAGLFGSLKSVAEVEAPKQAEPDRTSEAIEPGAGFRGRLPKPRRKPNQPEEEQDVSTLVTPDDVVGLDFAGMRTLLGDPALELEEPPAKIWAYNGGSCMFNVFFFPSVEDNVYRVLTYEVTGPVEPAADGRVPNPLSPTTIKIKDPKHPALQECFDELLRGRE